MKRLPHPRVALGALDQILSSVTNFGLALVVARSASREEFGAFSIVLGTYFVMLGVGRAVASSSISIRYADRSSRALRAAARAASGTAVVTGLILGVIAIVAALILSGALRSPLLVLGLCAPGLLLQDCWRYCFVAQQRPGHALANDAIWTFAQITGFVAVAVSGAASPLVLLTVWGVSANIAAAVGALQARLTPSIMLAGSWMRLHSDLVIPFALEALILMGATQLALIVVAALVGLSDAGILRAATTLFTPLNSVFVGALYVGVPEGARRLDRLRGIVVLTSFACIAITLSWAIVIVVATRVQGYNVVGESTVGARDLLLPMTLQFLSAAGGVGPQVGLRARGASSTVLLAQAQFGAALLVLSIGGAILFGVQGAAYGGALATTTNCAVWWMAWSTRKAGRERERQIIQPVQVDPRWDAVILTGFVRTPRSDQSHPRD